MERKWKRKSRKLAREMFWEKHKRESYKCPDCGRREDQFLNPFEVHHKDGQPLDNSPENHIALCRPCHNLRESKKPSYEEIKNIRDRLNRLLNGDSAVEVSNGSVETDPIMTPQDYTGDYGALVCPGCDEKLGNVRGNSTIEIMSRPCCDLTNVMPDVSSLVVIDRETASDADTSSERIKEWLVSSWCEYLKNESTFQIEMAYQTRSHGKPTVSKREKKVSCAPAYLADIKRLCEVWGWDHVRYAAEKSLEAEKPIKAFWCDLENNLFQGKSTRTDATSEMNFENDQIAVSELMDELDRG